MLEFNAKLMNHVGNADSTASAMIPRERLLQAELAASEQRSLQQSPAGKKLTLSLQVSYQACCWQLLSFAVRNERASPSIAAGCTVTGILEPL